jgi:hypothetical protein
VSDRFRRAGCVYLTGVLVLSDGHRPGDAIPALFGIAASFTVVGVLAGASDVSALGSLGGRPSLTVVCVYTTAVLAAGVGSFAAARTGIPISTGPDRQPGRSSARHLGGGLTLRRYRATCSRPGMIPSIGGWGSGTVDWCLPRVTATGVVPGRLITGF